MLTPYTIPNDLIGNPEVLPEFSVVNYSSVGDAVRNQIFISQNVISFLAKGHKEIHLEREPLSFGPEYFAAITSARCLMTETSSIGDYRSVLFFFSDAVLDDLRLKFKDKIPQHTPPKATLLFQYDDYLLHFRQSLEFLARQSHLSQELQRTKLEELFQYLFEKAPNLLAPILVSTRSNFELEFKQTVENNKFANLQIEEMAFLCHMSVSTFKRNFRKIYGLPPHQWMLRERMNQAGWLLRKKQAPNSIYSLVGYDSYPNFAKAFKQHFEVSPREYQTLNLQE